MSGGRILAEDQQFIPAAKLLVEVVLGALSPSRVAGHRLPQAERAGDGGRAVGVEIAAQAADQPGQFFAPVLTEHKRPAIRRWRNAGCVRVQGPVCLGEPAPELVGGRPHIRPGRQGVLGVCVQLVKAGRQGVPRRNGRRGLRRGCRQGIGLLADHGCPALLLVIDGERVNGEIARQLIQDGLALDPQLGGRALDAQRQDMVAAAGKLIPRGLRSRGAVPAPDLSHIPAQAQGVDYLERVLRPRHVPPLRQ